MGEIMEGELIGDQVTHIMAEGQRLGIRLTEGRVVMTLRPRQRVGLAHHAAAKVDPVNPPGTGGEGAYEESCPACHLSDALPRSGTRHPNDQLQQPLIGHGAALGIVGHLPIKLGTHLRLHGGRLLVSHGHRLQDVDRPSKQCLMVSLTAHRDKYFLRHWRAYDEGAQPNGVCGRPWSLRPHVISAYPIDILGSSA
jgi:hypothetical protein